MKESLKKLLEKYNVPGPRYTSYPTVPAWTQEVGVSDYESSLRSLHAGDPLSLYFHLPFCEKLCHFCGCMQVITKDHSRSRKYVDLVLKEIDRVVRNLPSGIRKVSQLHFGGGTPNFLQPQELTDMVHKVQSEFDLIPEAEIAIEMHPRTNTREFCENLAPLKFNRISLGIQDFDPKVQALINRNQTYELTEAMVTLLRNLGLNSFNFDLVYGLPGQSMEGWEKTLEQVLHLRPNRLAIYSYAHVPWVRPVQRSFKDSDLPSPKLKLEFFARAYTVFTKNGYCPIGLDHFALEEDDLAKALETGTIHRNFMGYSTQADAHQLGFGVSSISYAGGNYFQNLKELPAYEKTIEAGQLATFRGFLLSRDDALRRDLITQIMCTGKINIPAFEAKWKINFQEYFSHEFQGLKALEEDRLIEIEKDRLQATPDGFLFLRNIAMVFDCYLEGIRRQAVNPTFSKTV